MKALGILICAVGILLTGTSLAEEEAQELDLKEVAAALQRLENKIDQQQRDFQRRINDAEGKVNEITARMGDAFGRPTAFNTIERRLAAVEKKLDDLDRQFKRIENRLTALERKR